MLLTGYTETYVDENGVTHTYIYNDYTEGGPPLDKSSWAVLIFALVVIFGIALFHYYKAYKVGLIRKVCVEQIPALVVRIDASRSVDDHIRSRYKRYSVTYRYDYNGRTYSCRHRLWGSKSALGDLREGTTSIISICPGQPEIIYDRLAESARLYFLTTGVISTIAFVVYLLMIIFRDYL